MTPAGGPRVYPPCGTIYPQPYSKFTTLRLGYYRDPKISVTGVVRHDEYRVAAQRVGVSLYPAG